MSVVQLQYSYYSKDLNMDIVYFFLNTASQHQSLNTYSYRSAAVDVAPIPLHVSLLSRYFWLGILWS